MTGNGQDGVGQGRDAGAVEAQRTQDRDLTLSIGDGMNFGVMVGAGELYLQAFILAVGLGEVFAGLVASVPMLVGSLLQMVTPFAVRKLGSHKRWVVCCAAIQGFCFPPLVIAAIVGHISPVAVFVIIAIYWAANQATGPAWNTWQGTIIPRPIRARFFAKRTRLCQISTLIGFVGAALFLEWGKARGHYAAAFAVTFAVAFFCRILSTLCLAGQSEPTPMPGGVRFLSPEEQWRKFTRGPSGRLLLFAVAMQVGVYVAGPYFVPYTYQKLGYTNIDYAVLIGVSFIAKFLTLPHWGRVAHRTGARRLLWIGAAGVVPLSGGWVLSSNYSWLIFLQLWAGTFWAAYELALVLMFFDSIPECERTSLLTIYNVANSAASAVGAVIGWLVLKGVGLSATGYLAVFAASTLLRLSSLILLRRVPLSGPVAQPDVVTDAEIAASGEAHALNSVPD